MGIEVGVLRNKPRESSTLLPLVDSSSAANPFPLGPKGGMLGEISSRRCTFAQETWLLEFIWTPRQGGTLFFLFLLGSQEVGCCKIGRMLLPSPGGILRHINSVG